MKVRYKKQKKEGPELGYSESGGLQILEIDGLFFKDLAKTGTLVPYEDWRLPPEERAKDLATRLSVEELAGLMPFSKMIMVPNMTDQILHGTAHTYRGRPFVEGMDPAEVSDQTISMVQKDHIRHFSVAGCQSKEAMMEWNNRLQAVSESERFGIPCVKGSDPRHGRDAITRILFHPNEQLSVWAEGLGIAASWDEKTAFEYGRIVGKEFRALGIHYLMGPQIDTASDPRWIRCKDTYGSDTELITRIGRAVIDGMQTTEGAKEGWGRESIVAIVKHWPGGGTGEGGRDAHFGLGKYAVYPGGDFERHLRPFTEGAFRLNGPTKKAGAVMPYYTISYGIDQKYHENVGNAFSKYIIKDLLREKYQYDGVVCSDWEVITDAPEAVDDFAGKSWGVEHKQPEVRVLMALLAGIDQLGGIDTTQHILKAYELGASAYGEDMMRSILEEAACRILTNIFRLGLFENPYVDIPYGQEIIGCKEFREKAEKQQASSVVLLSNKDQALPIAKGTKIYMPKRYHPFLNRMVYPLQEELLKQTFLLAETPEEADVAIFSMDSPIHVDSVGIGRLKAGYSREDRKRGGNGYIPISLQYRPYTADLARRESIAGGDPAETFRNRSYYGKTAYNREDELDQLLKLKETMKEKPVIVILHMERPCVVRELEPFADGLLVDFGAEDKTMIKILSGIEKAAGRLPFNIPNSMEAVEKHMEDCDDIVPYIDTQGKCYKTGYSYENKED